MSYILQRLQQERIIDDSVTNINLNWKQLKFFMTGKVYQLRRTQMRAALLRKTMTPIVYQLIYFSWNQTIEFRAVILWWTTTQVLLFWDFPQFLSTISCSVYPARTNILSTTHEFYKQNRIHQPCSNPLRYKNGYSLTKFNLVKDSTTYCYLYHSFNLPWCNVSGLVFYDKNLFGENSLVSS